MKFDENIMYMYKQVFDPGGLWRKMVRIEGGAIRLHRLPEGGTTHAGNMHAGSLQSSTLQKCHEDSCVFLGDLNLEAYIMYNVW